MIEASPLALIAVGAARTILSPCVTRQIAHTATLYLLQGWTISSVIKVSSNENTGIRRHSMQRVERLAEPTGYSLTKRTAVALATIAAWGVYDIDVQRVITYYAPTYI